MHWPIFHDGNLAVAGYTGTSALAYSLALLSAESESEASKN